MTESRRNFGIPFVCHLMLIPSFRTVILSINACAMRDCSAGNRCSQTSSIAHRTQLVGHLLSKIFLAQKLD